MSSNLSLFFSEQSKENRMQYNKHPVLQIEPTGIVGKISEKNDAKGKYFEVSFLSTGENPAYPKDAVIQSATIRESRDRSEYSLADNNLTLGSGKSILGFSIHEVDIKSINPYFNLTSETAYPDHKVLALSVAYTMGWDVKIQNGMQLAVPQSMKNETSYRHAANSRHHMLEIS